MIKGTGVSGGIVVGRAFILKKPVIQPTRRRIVDQEIEPELTKLETAIEKSLQQIDKIKLLASKELGAEKASLFEAHQALLADQTLKENIEDKLKTELIAVEDATYKTLEEFRSLFDQMDDEYLRERAADIKDISHRLLNNLLGREAVNLSNLTMDAIVIADDLSPSDTITMNKEHVQGFATEVGGPTSHTAIIARSLEIPAVVGCGDLSQIQNGDLIVLDGEAGVVLVNPDVALLQNYQQQAAKLQARKAQLHQSAAMPAMTLDGHRVKLAGNIINAEGAQRVLTNGGEGIGLFRTEFLYMNQLTFPSEDQQFAVYQAVAQQMGNHPCIIRTLDVGGDKPLSYLKAEQETNPFLGYRAIRVSLQEVEMFKTQLRAILRASAYGQLKIMFPLISHISELRKAKEVLAEVKHQLQQSRVPFDPQIPVGMMIEVPSAAMTADIFAAEVDFFSIGTNDLCQYTLAVDRSNEKVADLCDPLHPAVLRLIQHVVSAGHQRRIPVGVCGEMAAQVENAVVLLGLGIDEFSMSPGAIPVVKRAIRKISWTQAQAVADQVMRLQDSGEIRSYLQQVAASENWKS